MLTPFSVILLAQIATATPVRTPVSAAPKSLSDVARERKLGKAGVKGGTLSVAGAPVSGDALTQDLDRIIKQNEREAELRHAKALADAYTPPLNYVESPRYGTGYAGHAPYPASSSPFLPQETPWYGPYIYTPPGAVRHSHPVHKSAPKEAQP